VLVFAQIVKIEGFAGALWSSGRVTDYPSPAKRQLPLVYYPTRLPRGPCRVPRLCWKQQFAVPRQVTDRLRVAAEGQPLIEASVELAPEFAQSPTLLGRLNFVEIALLFFETDQEYIVRPTQRKRRLRLAVGILQLPRRRLGNLWSSPRIQPSIWLEYG
jgi:hypothetical protein